MKGKLRKALTLLLAAVMMFSAITVLNPTEVKAAEYTAKLSLADADWNPGVWGDQDTAQTTVTGAGSYSLEIKAEEGAPFEGAVVFVIDIEMSQEALAAQNYRVSELKLTVDDAEFPIDTTKIVTGDLEEKGNLRIELYNEYGPTKEAAPFDPASLTVNSSVKVDFSLVETDEAAYDADGKCIKYTGLAGQEAAGYVAKFSYADADWNPGVWGDQDTAQTTVTGEGSYSMEITAAADAPFEGAVVFVIDIEMSQEALAAQNYRVSDLKLTVDGAEFPIDTAKIVTGDLEEKGNFRIELYNEYGPTKEDVPFDPTTINVTSSVKVDFSLAKTDEPAYDADGKCIKYIGLAGSTATVTTEETAAPVSVPEFDPAGKYMAYLGIQTPSWTYRDPWNSANGIGSEVWGQFMYNNDTKVQTGVVTDVEVAGNGTYTVSVTDFGTIFADDFTKAGQENFNLLYISTDIPQAESIKITDVKLIIDGKTIKTYKEGYLDPDDEDYVKILIQNIWNEDVKELPFYAAPATSVEMQFTISGFSYDNESAKVEEPAPTQPATTAPATTPTTAESGSSNVLPIVIVVVVVVVIAAAVAVVVLKKKKN